MAGVQRVTILERSEERLLLFLPLFLGECDIRAVRREVGVEAAVLANSVGPRLVAVDDLRVLLGVFVSVDVLLALVRVLRVAYLVKAGERLWLDSSLEPRRSLGDGTRRRAERDILKLRLAHFFVRAGQEGPLLRVRSHAAQACVVFTRVLIRVAKRVALELSKSLFRIFATVNGHRAILADLVALSSEGLVVGAIVANCEPYRH